MKKYSRSYINKMLNKHYICMIQINKYNENCKLCGKPTISLAGTGLSMYCPICEGNEKIKTNKSLIDTSKSSDIPEIEIDLSDLWEIPNENMGKKTKTQNT